MKQTKQLILIGGIIALYSSFLVENVGMAQGLSNAEVTMQEGNQVTRPVDPSNPDQPKLPDKDDSQGTGELGPLSIDFISTFEFGKQPISENTVVYKAKNKLPYIQVTDTRGTDEGWQLTASITPFRDTENRVLKGAQLLLQNGQKRTSSSNVSEEPTVDKKILLDSEESQLVMQAKKGSGRGTWLVVWPAFDQVDTNENVSLQVLGNSAYPTKYSATINWSLVSGPETL